MKRFFLFLLLSLLEPASGTIPKDVSFSKPATRQGLLSFGFEIPEKSTKASITMLGLDTMANFAEKEGYDISLHFKINHNRNISLALTKCRLRSATSRTITPNEIFVVPPRFFTALSTVQMEGCTSIDEPIIMLIHGEPNTTGTILMNLVPALSSKNEMFNSVAHAFYPLIFSLLILGFAWACSSTTIWTFKYCILKLRQYQHYFGYPKAHPIYKFRGTPV
ncbi:hypothetical protein B9Z55_026579 [Caenorhabditis nigoni]|uniref:Uncharacterized protein n=1 Tax=Caenorhabditis nigoni TaxID=1611254 RepID=A0A2G5T3S8_9PELO|nr:hypothetical protein B9Z55_026579 [Caenorhabditis nigoni]